MAKRILKRTIFLWGLPTIFVVVLLLLMFCRPLFRSATSFGFHNANKIKHIALIDSSGEVRLDKRRGQWFIRGGCEAQQSKVADALYALQMMEAKYPLTQEQQQKYANILNDNGLRITVSGWLGSLCSYSLYSCDTLLVGMVRSGKPFAVDVRSNEALDVLSLLEAKPLAWCKTNLFTLHPAQIAAVTVEDLTNPQHSFKLSIDTLGQAKLQELYSDEIFSRLNKNRVSRYLSYYQNVNFERYATELSDDETETIILSDPAYIITLETTDGATRVAKLFFIPVGDEFDAFGRATDVDLNRCYLQQDDDPNLAVALWVDIDLLIKDVKFFLTK